MGRWPVILTPQSLNDLREIVSFIARDNTERAVSFGNELIEKALFIGTHPEMGRVVPEEHDPNVREIVHRAYRIIYESFAIPTQFSSFVSGTVRGARQKFQTPSDRNISKLDNEFLSGC